MRALLPYLQLMRPINSAMVGLAVIVGIAVASPRHLLEPSAPLGFLTGFLVASYSMVINDAYDLEVDRVNEPGRPLPSGRASIEGAWSLAALLLALGLLSSSLVGPLNLGIAGLFALLAWLYNSRVKRLGLWGNLLVASSLAIPYIYGGVAVGLAASPLVWYLALTSLLAGLGREIIKSIADVEGDKVRGIRSLAITQGSIRAAKIGVALFLAAIATSFLPYLLGLVGLLFLLLVLIPDALLLMASRKVLKEPDRGGALRSKGLALYAMLLGLFAFLVGGSLRF